MKTISEIKDIINNEFVIINKDINRKENAEVIAIHYIDDRECYEVITNTTTKENLDDLNYKIKRFEQTNHPFHEQAVYNTFAYFGEKDYFYSEPTFKVGDIVVLEYTDNVEDFTIVR